MFERRHRAILITSDGYLTHPVRYIHLNPVTAGMVVAPARYPWSSHRAYLGHGATAWLTTTMVLALFGSCVASARSGLERFVAAERDKDLERVLVRGCDDDGRFTAISTEEVGSESELPKAGSPQSLDD